MEWPERYRDTAPPPGWEPKSAYFQAIWAKKRRKLVVQEAPKEHGSVLAFCTYHHSAYLSSDEFPNSPCCSTPPLLTYNLELILDIISDLAGLGSTEAGAAAVEPGEVSSTAPESIPLGSAQGEPAEPLTASVEDATPTGGTNPPATPPPAGEDLATSRPPGPRPAGKGKKKATAAAAA